MEKRIEGGYFKVARRIWDSQIIDKPDSWFKFWIFLISKVNYGDNNRFPRGTGFFNLRKVSVMLRVKYNSITKCIKWLKSAKQIATRKTTRGIIVTLLNYEPYQNHDNYTGETESYTKSEKAAIQKLHRSDTISNKGNESNKDKKEYKPLVFLTVEEYEKLLQRYGSLKTIEMIECLSNHKQANGKKYKSDYHAILNWVVDRTKAQDIRITVNQVVTERPTQAEPSMKRERWEERDASVDEQIKKLIGGIGDEN